MNKHFKGYEPHEFPPDYQGKFFLEWQMDKMYEVGFDWALKVILFVIEGNDFQDVQDVVELIKSLKEGETP